MKRKLKNIIMIIAVVLTVISMVFTVYYVKKNNNISNNMGNNLEANKPDEMPNSSSNEGMEMPKDNSNDQNKENSNDNSNDQDKENSNDNLNNGQDSDITRENDNVPDNNMMEKKSDNGMPTMPGNTNNKIEVKYYGIFLIESLILSVLVIYLIMSHFNKKTFKETFKNSDKVVINILSIIILTSLFTYINKEITENYLKEEKMEDKNLNNSNNTSVKYSATKEISEESNLTDQEYSSSEKNKNALLVTGDTNVVVSNSKIVKTGDSTDSDNTSFYGTNAGILAKDKANLTLKNIEVTTNAKGANGVFSYGGSISTNNTSSDKTTINISDSKITTTGDNSGGIMTTGGGIMNASNLTINTSGVSSAAIRTDRGGGEVNVDSGTYKTTGSGSPAIYSTANINVSNATLISEASEGIIIEGKNSVTITNSNLTDTNNKLNGKSTTYKNIFLYQSMSGDASVGEATFTAKNSKITTNKGDSFYVTNTTATINLENSEIINNDSSANFLRIQKDSWGTTGSNGGNVTLNMKMEKVEGAIVVDSISTLTMNLEDESSFVGQINNSNSAKEINLKLSKNSKIKLTQDSYISKLTNEDTSNSNIDFNGYKLYVNNEAIN